MPQPELQLFPTLAEYLSARQAELESIIPPRRELLDQLATHIGHGLERRGACSLLFICTHNSRRSHLAQVWAQTAAAYYGFDGVSCFSGGTEITACNPRTVAALARCGFMIEISKGENPPYRIGFSPERAPICCFSKLFDDKDNPSSEFAAVMTCSHADAACPLIPGATARFAVSYDDPKASDGTPDETAVYDARCRQIAREMLYCLAQAG